MTDTGIQLLDIYILIYAKMKVIFQVCKTTNDTVCLIELAVKKYKDGYCLTKNLNPSKKPLIIKDNNVFTRSTYEVDATREDKKLPIYIGMGSDIYWEAFKYVKYPKVGTFLAVPFPDYLGRYWKKPKTLKEEQRECYYTNLA